MMPSSIPSDALPVRRVANSFLRTSRPLFIFSSAFFFCSLSIVPPGYERPDGFTQDDLLDVARDGEVEDENRKIVVLAQGNGGGVHDAEVLLQHVVVRQAVELGGGPVLHG